MQKTKTYKSDALAAIHETVCDMFTVGVVDKKTMRRFDKTCLMPVHSFTAEEIRSLREREEVSQAVFGYHLNISKDTVSQWERGIKKPAGSSLKLLSLVAHKGLNVLVI
jgi:putative transcriptional regulator